MRLRSTAIATITCPLCLFGAANASVVAHWSFDSDFTDSTANNNDLSPAGGSPIITLNPGDIAFGAGALDLDKSTNAYLTPATNLSFGTADAWSVSFWARRRLGANAPTGMVMGDNTTTDSFIWLPDNSNVVQGMRFRPVGVGTGNSNDYATGHDSDFHHWVVVADGSGTIRTYRDNTDLGTRTPSGGTDFDINAIGSGYTGTNQIFDGQLDEIYIFDEAISRTVVKSLFTSNTVSGSDPDPTLDVFFDFNHTTSFAPSDWVAVNAAQGGNGGQITQTDTATGIAVTLNVGNGQTDLLGRTRTLDKADPAVTLGDMFEDFVIRVGDIEVSGLTPNGEYDLSFIMYDDDEPDETVTQSVTNTTGGASTLLGEVSWDLTTTLDDDDAQRLVATGLVADASGVLSFDLSAVGNGGNALINGLIVEPVIAGLPGDTDNDGDIDDSDLGTAFSNYTGPLPFGTGGKTAADGDTDGDGDVDDSDLGTAFSGYTGPLGPASVPEPTSLALMGLGALAIARRRRS